MPSTTNLQFPYLEAAQAQKHVTVNETVRALDALVHLAVVSRTQSDPPGSPSDGIRYIPAATATGVWSGKEGQIAAYQDGAWAFLTPREGWRAWVGDEERLLIHDGTNWSQSLGSAEFDTLTCASLGGAGSSYLVIDSIKPTSGDPSGSEGMLYVNTADNAVRIFAGGAWRSLVNW